MAQEIKYFEISKLGWEKTSIVPVRVENIENYTWNDELEEWKVSASETDVVFTGFTVWNGKEHKTFINHEMHCECFNEVKFEIISSETDFYGTGNDRVLAKVDDEEAEYFETSRWQGDIGYERHLEDIEE